MIRSGDTFHIRRLDGIDPMIAWAMGSATGTFNFIIVSKNNLNRPYDHCYYEKW